MGAPKEIQSTKKYKRRRGDIIIVKLKWKKWKVKHQWSSLEKYNAVQDVLQTQSIIMLMIKGVPENWIRFVLFKFKN